MSRVVLRGGVPWVRHVLTVKALLVALATYPDPGTLGVEHPDLEEEDVREALLYAASMFPDR